MDNNEKYSRMELRKVTPVKSFDMPTATSKFYPSITHDLYPVSVAMDDLLNEELENRRRRNSNARAYDKDMFKNVAVLDEAQTGRDRLVAADTKGGTRRIAEGEAEDGEADE